MGQTKMWLQRGEDVNLDSGTVDVGGDIENYQYPEIVRPCAAPVHNFVTFHTRFVAYPKQRGYFGAARLLEGYAVGSC